MTQRVAGLDGDTVEVGDDALDRLGSRLQGTILRPDDHGFDDATLIWNATITRRPTLAVRPQNAQDVAETVDFARANGLLLSVKGGGHNIAGTSLADGGLLLDMSAMRTVDVDADARTAAVGPGCLLQDVDRVTQQQGLAAVLGFVSETGLAGLTLGGGFGYLSRRFGWTVDNLLEVDVVTADGQLRRASRDSEPDLFWALRGGGGNFGVVTRFVLRLHEVGPQITGGLIAWDGARSAEVVDAFREITAAAPRTLTTAVSLRLAPPAPFVPEEWHGRPIVAIVVCHTGDDTEVARDMAAIRGIAEPLADVVTDKPYAEQQSMLDATQPKGLNYYWKTEFVPGIGEGLAAAIRESGADVPNGMSQVIAFHLGGAIADYADDDGAMGNRDAEFMCGAAGTWSPGADGDAVKAWVRSSWEAVRPHSTGGNYVNFQLDEDDDARTREAYGDRFERLARVKAAYDPGNLFRVNRNIAPRT